MNRKLYNSFVIATILFFLMSISVACTTDEIDQTPDNAISSIYESSPSESTKLLVWVTGSEDEAQILTAAAKLFMQNYPEVTIEVQPLPWDNANANLLSTITSKSGPDIITGKSAWATQFGQFDGLVELKTEFPELFDEIANIAQTQLLNSISSPNGEIYGVPWNLEAMLMYYRSDLIEKAPESWSELTDEIEKQQAAGRKGFGMGWGNLQWQQFFNYLYASNGRPYDKDCTSVTINDSVGLTALNFYASLYNQYDTSKANTELASGLESGDYPLGIDSSSLLGKLDYSQSNLAVATLPKGPSGKSTAFIDGDMIGITTASLHPDAAVHFVRSLYTPEATETMSTAALKLGLFYVPPGEILVEQMQTTDEFKEVFKAVLADSVGPPNCPTWEQVKDSVINPLLEEALIEDADTLAILDSMAEAMNHALKP